MKEEGPPLAEPCRNKTAAAETLNAAVWPKIKCTQYSPHSKCSGAAKTCSGFEFRDFSSVTSVSHWTQTVL